MSFPQSLSPLAQMLAQMLQPIVSEPAPASPYYDPTQAIDYAAARGRMNTPSDIGRSQMLALPASPEYRIDRDVGYPRAINDVMTKFNTPLPPMPQQPPPPIPHGMDWMRPRATPIPPRR